MVYIYIICVCVHACMHAYGCICNCFSWGCIFSKPKASDNLLDALLQMKADVNAQDHRGVGALHSLALSGNMRLMKWLMTHSADLDLQTEHGTTALMLASKRGSEEGVAMLLAARANPNLSNKAGSTALVQAFASNMNVTGCVHSIFVMFNLFFG